jgi:prepilin-type N-terminal cleavage/methylation domain-containing protein
VSKFHSKKGFTLVEVMVVAAVLAILATIALYTFVRVSDTAKKMLCLGNQRVIYEAAVLYGLYEPDNLADKSKQGRCDALYNKGYIRNRTAFECPASPDPDYDDYNMIFDGDDNIQDVECGIKGNAHKWPPED